MIAHLRHWFPSWPALLIVAVAVPLIIYGIHAIDRHSGIDTEQEATWALVNLLGWWRYSAQAALSAVGLYYMARLDPPINMAGALSRVLGSIGMIFYVWAPGNVALSPLASILVLLALVLGIRQIALLFIERRRVLGETYDLPLGLRFLVALVSHRRRHDDVPPPL